MSATRTTILRSADERINHLRSIPFYLVHAVALATPFVLGWSWKGVLVALGFYYLRMVGITMGYHRYFSHRAFKTSRVFQFVMALVGTASSQKGVLWWAAHHRHHHKVSDRADDIHSPRKGFLWSQYGWFLCDKYQQTELEQIRDFAIYPELRWLDRGWGVVVVAYATLLFLIGGWFWLLWGFFVSTTLLWHGTFFVNSLAHVFGRRRYGTSDDSRNSLLIALITCGEGWHNNHHHYQSTANQGFFWWEVDFTYYLLRGLAAVGVVWDLRTPPPHILQAGRAGRATLARPVASTAVLGPRG